MPKLASSYIKSFVFSPHIFRANDIRGRYPVDFDLSFTKDLAYALCRLIRQKKISSPKFLVGRDTRLSSPEISRALLQNLRAQGAGTAFIGLAPSPLCYFLLNHHKLTACVVVTASHNPSEFNGFKILFHKKHKSPDVIQNLKSILLKTKKPSKVFSKKGNSFKITKEAPYISSLKKEFSLKPRAFAIDTGNGALGPLAKKVYSALGLKPIYLFNQPDGRFLNHHPDPTVEKNLLSLKRVIQKKKLSFGFAFDGDGDRLVLVNGQGKTVLGDEFGYLFLKSLSRKNPIILADVKCSDWFFNRAKKEGLKVIMAKSGHGLIRSQLKKTGAALAIEFSGHIFFNDRKGRGSDDALYASLRLLELLKERDLMPLLPPTSNARTAEIRIDMPLERVKKQIKKIKSYLRSRGERFQSLDGVRLSRSNSWALFRGSKTQEALTMRFEADKEKTLLQLKREFSKVMGFKIP